MIEANCSLRKDVCAEKAPEGRPKASGGSLLSFRRAMLKLAELLGATLDLQECSTEFPGTLRGVLGELSGRSSSI